jgi:hypothetical protein
VLRAPITIKLVYVGNIRSRTHLITALVLEEISLEVLNDWEEEAALLVDGSVYAVRAGSALCPQSYNQKINKNKSQIKGQKKNRAPLERVTVNARREKSVLKPIAAMKELLSTLRVEGNFLPSL